MTRSFFVLFTLFLGILVEFFFHHYLSIGSAAPDAFLLLTMAFGFGSGPVMGQTLGFLWGLVADASGTELFGMSALVLTIAGFAAGTLRRRVASERLTGQLVIALTATVYQALMSSFLLSSFESAGRINFGSLLVEIVLNAVFVPWIFIAVDKWLDAWAVEREHI